jgi:hypothetical protein
MTPAGYPLSGVHMKDQGVNHLHLAEARARQRHLKDEDSTEEVHGPDEKIPPVTGFLRDLIYPRRIAEPAKLLASSIILRLLGVLSLVAGTALLIDKFLGS